MKKLIVKTEHGIRLHNAIHAYIVCRGYPATLSEIFKIAADVDDYQMPPWCVKYRATRSQDNE